MIKLSNLLELKKLNVQIVGLPLTTISLFSLVNVKVE